MRQEGTIDFETAGMQINPNRNDTAAMIASAKSLDFYSGYDNQQSINAEQNVRKVV